MLKISIAIILIFAVFPNIYPASFRTDSIRIRKDIKSYTEIRDQDLVRQTYDYTCGAAAVATIINYIGGNTDEREILEIIISHLTEEELMEKDALSLLELKRAVEKKGDISS